MSDADQQVNPEQEAERGERWMFGGNRIDRKGGRLHAWVAVDEGLDRDEMLFVAKGHFAVGSVYDVRVRRFDDGRVTRVGSPVYSAHRAEDENELRARLSAAHTAAEVELKRRSWEREDRRNDPVTLLVDQLAEIARTVPPAQRYGFAAYVMTRLSKGW
jgi:hypothetical protein